MSTWATFYRHIQKWDQRHSNLRGIRDPRIGAYLVDENWDPRFETLYVRTKTWDSCRTRDSRPKAAKLETGVQDLLHLSCLWFDTQYAAPLSKPNKWYCNKIPKRSFAWCQDPRFEFSLNGSSKLKIEGHRK